MIEQQEERKIPIGYVAKSRMNAWGESHANFQKALSGEEIEEHIQSTRRELIAWVEDSGNATDILMSYIGEEDKDFSEGTRNYLLRRFVEATANGVIFESKSFTQVESETICSQDWIKQMIGEAAKEIKSRVEADTMHIQAISFVIATGMASMGHHEFEGESDDDDSAESEDGGVRPPYSDY